MFEVKADLKAFLKDLEGDKKSLARGVAYGMFRVLEEIRGKIARTTLGPKVWDQPSKPESKAYSMALNIAKREGHTNFSKGSAGRSRVRELAPKMATKRPGGNQKVWIQSGALRKSMDWRVIGRNGVSRGSLVASIQLSPKAYAVGHINSPKDYAEKIEGRYEFAAPVAKAYIKSAAAKRSMETEMQRAVKRA